MSISEQAGANAPKPSPTLGRPRRLVGRENEIRDVSESVASAPVTTLLGPGGVGKTALAVAVAAACSQDFPGGVTVVWLGSLRSADLVAAEVATQLGLPRSGGQSYEAALTGWLTERDVLLVIDNCEHVVSAVADLVEALTARLPRLRVLATSREPLWIDGEVTYRLAPLAVVGADASFEELAASSAVQLFRERAGARARGALDTERACRLFGEICRRVDGLPLAIELAAARVAGLDPEDIASHLDDLFTLLPQPARRADGAQRSLRATVEWSDALLSEEERRLLRRMGVFAGRFDLGAIKEVCALDGQTAARVADLTARLVEKSLLLNLGDGGGYQLLETIRQYSIEQLTATGEIDAVRGRRWPGMFCTWHVANGKRANGDADAAIAIFNECAEMARGCGLRVGEMVACNTLGEIWDERGVLDQSRQFWERTLRCRREIEAVDVGHLHGSMPLNLLAIARVAAKQGDLATASKLLREALPIAHELRDELTAQQIAELLAHTSRVEPTQSATLRPEAGVWHVAFNGTSVHVPDMKGLWHIRELVARPRSPLLALSFIAAPTEEPLPIGDAGPMLDREALRQYRKRLADLDQQLDEAEAKHDVAGHAKRSDERDALLKELARATGLGGKPRRTGSPTERARLNVTRTIRHAITYLSTALPELAAHLDESVATGASCCYEPRTNIAWTT